MVGLVGWAAAAIASVLAAPELARGQLASEDVLLCLHLVGLGFLGPVVSAAVLQVVPVLLRTSPTRTGPFVVVPLLAAGLPLAVGIALDSPWLVRPTGGLVALGLLLVCAELVRLAIRAPRDRVLLASRLGLVLAAAHAGLALVAGTLVFERGFGPFLGVGHDRLIGIHLHLAVVGWLTLLIVTVGRTLVPMLTLAPAPPRPRAPLDELLVVAGLWLLVVGLALANRPLLAAGGVTICTALVRLGAVVARRLPHRGDHPVEAPLVGAMAGVVLAGEAIALGAAMIAGLEPTAGRLVAYVVLLLPGWAGAFTLGHGGRLLGLAAWMAWPPGPRPRQVVLHSRLPWLAASAALAMGVQLLAVGALASSPAVAVAGATALAGSAALALAAAFVDLGRYAAGTGDAGS